MLNVKDNPNSSWIEDNILLRQAMLAMGVDFIDSGRGTLDKVAETYCKYTEMTNISYCKEVL